jgi:hypothetical protein
LFPCLWRRRVPAKSLIDCFVSNKAKYGDSYLN